MGAIVGEQRTIQHGPQEADAAALRLRQRLLWDRTAGRRAVAVTCGHSLVTRRLLEAADIQPNSVVLDVACGTGDPSIAAAQVAKRGHVLGLDISPAMVFEARRAAVRAGLHNVTFRVIEDETALDVAAQSVDAVLCRFGLMFMPNPVAALRSWVQGLVPGGRIVLCTHATMPAFEITMREVERHAPLLAAALEWRRVFSLSSQPEVVRHFVAAGLIHVAVRRDRMSNVPSMDLEECWEAMLRRSPLQDEFDALHPSVSRSIRDGCIRRLTKLRLPLHDIFTGDVLYAVGFVPFGASAASD